MGNRKGHNEAQSMDEMLSSMNEAKTQGLSTTKGRSIYKQESGEYQEEKLKLLITDSLEGIKDFATKEKVSLSDFDEVRTRTILYMRACIESGTFPSSLGLARSLGYSDRALRHWRSKQPNTETAQWLEMFNDTCADIIGQSALKNNANSIVSIFLSKALYDFSDKTELVVTPNTVGSDEEDSFSVEEIRARYGIKTDDNSDE